MCLRTILKQNEKSGEKKMVSSNKKEDLVKSEWKKKRLASLESYVFHKGSLQ